ncbi:hypothetical protein J437_LFUL006263 [Ladona fulva]|uniref:Uncharacterized protein n=1 Tax=Ladona fulva TaxID=123851 RepID=A0A8K0JYA4_LADFU|nr:hypothetical protein J437_LFUL006263 [Ladona fulva]
MSPRKLGSQLTRVKDQLELKTPRVYYVPCECGSAYIAETGRMVETRLMEHARHICLSQQEKSAIAKHFLDKGHRIHFKQTKVLCRAPSFWDQKIKESIEIPLEENNLNREEGFTLHKTWTPILQKILERGTNQ